MRVLLIAPSDVPYIPGVSKYTGIERLVWEYSRELIKKHEVTVIAHTDSLFPPKVQHLPAANELQAHLAYSGKYTKFDIIHDFSHLHLASRYHSSLPSINVIWHAPGLAKYPKAPYNILCPSEWGVREFERVYHQGAKCQFTVGIDTKLYKPNWSTRNDRLFALGRMGEEKGNLEAVMLCKNHDFKLDLQAARGLHLKEDDPLTDYEKAILGLCDSKQIKFLGDLPEKDKIKLMRSNKALIYVTRHPEITTHKGTECLLCGMPVIVSDVGAAREWVTQGVDGYLCRTEEDFILAIKSIGKLSVQSNYNKIVERFSIINVVKNYQKLYEEVAKGLRW